MIRGRIAQIRRDAGVCAFCQHRLLAQRSLRPQSRPLSSTTTLRQDGPHNPTPSAAPRPPGLGGWGPPRGGIGWGGSSLAKPANGAIAGAANASENLLSPYELEQRKRLLAQREAELKPAEVQKRESLPAFRHVFNPEEQTAMYENWQKEAADKKAGVGSSVRIDTLAGRQLDPPVSSTPKPTVDHSRARGAQPSDEDRIPVTTIPQSDMPRGRKSWSAPAMASRKAAIKPKASATKRKAHAAASTSASATSSASPSTTGVKQPFVQPSSTTADIAPKPQPLTPSKPKAWASLATKVYTSEPSRPTATATQASPTAAPVPAPTQEPDVGAWSQLQRKATPPKKDGTANFFDNLLKKEPQSAKEEPMEDWGLELDNGLRRKKKEDPYAAKVDEATPEDTVSEFQADISPAKAKVERRGRLEYEVDETDSHIPEQKGGKRVQKKSGRGGRGASSRYEEDDEMDEDEFNAYEAYLEKQRLKAERKAAKQAERTGPIPIKLPELITISALASALKIEVPLFLDQLAELGFEDVTQDSIMAGETAALVAQEYGYEPTVDVGVERDLKPRLPAEDPSLLPQRPPVVTIMGHVDHGKTTLLDFLRKSSVAAQEHGGITQHIGAFSVKMSSGKQITFLDTPGHAAFLTMRQRGANVTDIVVLVVAADDSVKPQTLEALKHARGAKVPIIVAINKVDKDTARVEQVKNDLARNGVELEDFGGDVQVVCVSGKTGLGMDELEENIVTLAEILDMRAEDDGPAEGWILESSLKASGKVATVLVRRGTMRPGDIITAGTTFAKIRHLRNEAGVNVTEAGPGTAIEIYGWRELPAAGDEVIQASDEGRARTAIEYREGLREQEQAATDHAAISEVRNVQDEQRRRAMQTARAEVKDMNRGKFTARKAAFLREAKLAADEVLRAAEGESDGPRLINFAVKADVHGSVEAVCSSIQEIGNNEVTPRILRSGAGPITEFDVEHAAMSGSVIVNFATTTPSNVKRLADEQGVKIIDHTIIYHLIDDVKATLSSFLTPDVASKVLGEAEVQQVFQYNTKGRAFKNIAGCRVRNGVVAAGSMYRIFRGGEKIFEGKLETLKHHKKDVTEMRKGTECGMGFEEFQDVQAGDQIQAYEEIRTARKL